MAEIDRDPVGTGPKQAAAMTAQVTGPNHLEGRGLDRREELLPESLKQRQPLPPQSFDSLNLPLRAGLEAAEVLRGLLGQGGFEGHEELLGSLEAGGRRFEVDSKRRNLERQAGRSWARGIGREEILLPDRAPQSPSMKGGVVVGQVEVREDKVPEVDGGAAGDGELAHSSTDHQQPLRP